MNFKTAELIRSEYHNTTNRQVDLAKKYNCGQRAVSEIVNNKRWKPKVAKPDVKDRFDMKLVMVNLWCAQDDLHRVMSYDKTRRQP